MEESLLIEIKIMYQSIFLSVTYVLTIKNLKASIKSEMVLKK